MDGELDLFYNRRITGCEMHVADKRRNAWRVSDDSNRGVIRLIGAGNTWDDKENTSEAEADNTSGNDEKF